MSPAILSAPTRAVSCEKFQALVDVEFAARNVIDMRESGVLRDADLDRLASTLAKLDAILQAEREAIAAQSEVPQ